MHYEGVVPRPGLARGGAVSAKSPNPLVTRVAANVRSPNRKPRYRTALNDYLQEHEWEQFLALCALEGDSEAYDKLTPPCDDKVRGRKIANTRGCIWYYVNMHGEELRKERVKQWAAAKGRFAESLEELRTPMVAMALEVEREILADREKNWPLAHDAAKAQLKGVGYWSEKSKVEIGNKDNQPFQVRVIFGDATSDKPFKQISDT